MPTVCQKIWRGTGNREQKRWTRLSLSEGASGMGKQKSMSDKYISALNLENKSLLKPMRHVM